MKSPKIAPEVTAILRVCSGVQEAGSFHSRFKAVAFDYFVLFDPNSVLG